jgi:hypothetical protein
LVLDTAVYENVTNALDDFHALKQLHKDDLVGRYGAAVIDQANGKPHIAARVDRPRIRAILEMFGGGTLPRKQLQEAALELTPDEAGLIVVGEPTLEKGFDEAITRTARIVRRSVVATTDELAGEFQEVLGSEE